MNLIALATLNAYIALELQALQVLVAYQVYIKGYATYKPLYKKLCIAVMVYHVSFFRLYLTDLECFDTVQCIDLELPLASVFVQSYCVVHSKFNTYFEYASANLAIKVCKRLGIGYSVICKYCDPSQYGHTWHDDRVFECVVNPSLSILVINALSRFEIVCVEMLLFWFKFLFDPNSTDYKKADLLDETIFNHKYDRYPLLFGHKHNSDIFTKSIFALTA